MGVCIFNICGSSFNLLILIFGINVDNYVAGDRIALARKFLQEIFLNVSFSIVVALTLVMVLGVSLFLPHNGGWMAMAIFIYGFGVFGVSILMVLKRIYSLFVVVRGS